MSESTSEYLVKLNELVCPHCGLKCMVSASYTTCASCGTYFHACQSRSVDNPQPLPPKVNIGPNILPSPTIQPWVVPMGPYGPGTTGGDGTICVTTSDQSNFQFWN